MTGEELGAIGETAGGAGAARALEPGHGEAAAAAESGRCLNCGCALEGAYCHCCGQKAEVHFTLSGLLHDIVHGVLHLDGKFWRTLPRLVWRPGELTRDYVAGKRARYISPIALYLFTVVAMFALVVSVGDVDADDVRIGASAADIETVAEAESRVASLEQTLEDMAGDDYPGASGARTGVRAELAATQRRLRELEGKPDPERAPVDAAASEGDTLVAPVDSGPLESFLNGLTTAASFEALSENPSLFLYKVQTKAYKLSWLLIPLSLPFLWLLFPLTKRFGMYHHAVFVTYSISFMMLFTVTISLLARAAPGADWLIVPILLVPPLHMYRQLKGAYGLGRLSALLRTVLLALFALVTLVLFLVLMLLIGAVG
nr:DUF3667 domain-containing protein [Sphingomicrobium astaxanthinifaciens]